MRKLKGVCQIKLFDTTGKIVKETHDENVVTNALSSLFALKQSDLLTTGFDLKSQTYPTYTPLTTSARLGGVVCFESAIQGTDAELATARQPSLEHVVTAHSGNDVYTGNADLSRGSYNETESGAVEGGYRYVWDFATSQGNGTIGCVCLTSATGGANWWCEDNAVVPSTIIWNTIYTNAFSISSTAGNAQIIGKYNNSFLYYVRNSSNQLSLYLYSPQTTISINDTIYPRPSTDAELVATGAEKTIINTVATLNTERCFSFDGAVFASAHNNSPYSYGSTVDVVLISVAEMVKTEVSIQLPSVMFAWSNGSWYHVKDGYFYAIGKTVDEESYCAIYKISLSDSADVTRIDLPFACGSPVFRGESNGNIVLLSNITASSDNGINCAYFNGATVRRVRIPYKTSPSSNYYNRNCFELGNGYLVYCYDNSSTRYYSVALDEAYLATIDNLATPVTKTNAQTMKIIYTVTEDTSI